jgi:superfamily II RNA helicase
MTLSKYLHIVDISTSPESFPENAATLFPFPLDPFQTHAISAIYNHENVLVTAKTGSGKTLVGEYQIAHSLQKGKRVFYTTPIKSLSNQKFHDLKQIYGDRVGIMTGDIKFKPDAEIVIMTTEILKNLLYKYDSTTKQLGLTASLSIDNLDAVVFDEVHYINNKERGRVWEETLILLPPSVNLVLLSATIEQPEHFASWLGELKQKPIHLISTQYRIVPLTHAILMGKNPYTIMDHKEGFHAETYNNWLKSRKQVEDDYRMHKQNVAGRRAGGYEDPTIKGTKKPVSFQHTLNETLRNLEEKELLPALVFSFSRKGCEAFANKLEGTYLTGSESASVKHIVRFHLHRFPSVFEKVPQYFTLMSLLERGIAFHHSGLLPLLKEIVEILFGKGLIKVLFATETFAVGINMPTKTVIFTGFHKFDETSGGHRILDTDEYIQMAGRAGRRGKDKEGLVLYVPERDPISLYELQSMMKGHKKSITSRMSFHYDFLLKTLQSGNLNWLRLMEQSYWFTQSQKSKELTQKEISSLEEKIKALGLTKEQLEDMDLRASLELTFKSSTNAAKKDAQKKLEAWRNKHQSPIYDLQWKNYKEYKNLEAKLKEENDMLEDLNSYASHVFPYLEVLQSTGFLKSFDSPYDLTSQHLTEKGVLATEINEGHPLLLAEAFTNNLCDDLSGDEIVAFLSAFLMEKADSEDTPSLDSLQVPSSVVDSLKKLDSFVDTFWNAENKHACKSPEGFWDLNSGWIDLIWRWITEDVSAAELCATYEIYEGNFIRAILKMANLVEEWTNLATYTKNTKMLEKMEGLQQRLLRDIVIPDSLYLRI